MREISVDISQEAVSKYRGMGCPFRNSEWNICEIHELVDIDCCIWDEEAGAYHLNPLCPLLAGDVVVRGRR